MKLSWIECNLPFFNSKIDVDKFIKYPNYYNTICKKFGKEFINEIEKLKNELENLDPNYKFIYSLPKNKDQDYEWMLEKFPEKLIYINKLKKYRELNFKVIEFYELYTKDISEKNEKIRNEFKDESFMGLGLNKPGTVIELNSGLKLLTS
jgi:hypothetical protein